MTPRTRLVWHVAAPIALVLPLVLGYFYGPPALRGLIAPEQNRELGLLEHLQVAVLLVQLGVLVHGFRRASSGRGRLLLGAFGLGTLFLVLEELDYGLHHYAYFTGRSVALAVRNIHNQGSNSGRLKLLGDLVVVLLFVVLPLARVHLRLPLLRELAPSPWFAATVVVMLALSKLAHGMESWTGFGEHPLRQGISEFRELASYYLFLLYAIELVWQRGPALLAPAGPGSQRAPERAGPPGAGSGRDRPHSSAARKP